MTPIYKIPSHIPSKQTSRVFHRDHAGKIVAEFYGPDHIQNAIEFCELLGEPNGDPKFGNNRPYAVPLTPAAE